MALNPATATQVTILSKPGCHLCEEAKAVLQQWAPTYALTVQDIPIADNVGLMRRYGEELPVIFLNGRRVATHRINPTQWLRWLRREQRRQRRVHL